MLDLMDRIMSNVRFWLPLVALFLFLGFRAEVWQTQLLWAILSTVAISGTVTAHLSEWKATDYEAF